MNLKELMQKVVETENIDERMQLVEDNSSLMETELDTSMSSEPDPKIVELEQELALQKQKYRDRFFQGQEPQDTQDTQEPPKKPSKSLNDILNNKG